jgi:RNA recognition motif-containing protein
MQKRKVGPNKFIQFAFVSFENESDCAEAFKAHSQIAGEKVNISYAFLNTGKQQANTNNKQEQKPGNNNKNQEKTPTKPTPKTEKPEKKKSEKQLSTNSLYVGQLPEHVVEDDIQKLFPKANKIELFPAKAKNKGVRPGFAFITFPDDNSAAAAVKLGPSLTLKNTQLKVAYQTKRATATTAE